MSKKKNKIVVLGAGKLAEELSHYIREDSDFEIVAHAVESRYLDREMLCGAPVISLEALYSEFSPRDYFVITAVGYQNGNNFRKHLYEGVRSKGYQFVSYINSSIFNKGRFSVGENTVILENNSISNTSTIGNNVVLWSGNVIGHHVQVGDNCYVAGQVSMAGGSIIGDGTFVGVNALIGHGVEIGKRNIIGAGARILSSTADHSVYLEKGSPQYRLDTDHFLRITKL